MPNLSISIVSHRQMELVQSLLKDLQQYCSGVSIEVILTVNVEETILFAISDYAFPIRIISNETPKGFGENHNAAFRQAQGKYFCVLNPDIRLNDNPFGTLIELAQDAGIGIVAPRIVNIDGVQEDSAREFPSRFEIIKKVFGGKSATHADTKSAITQPDWVAGMFMVIPSQIFQEIGGFDERYFLYYEDVDLCVRMTLAGYKILMCSKVSVVHNARRSSHRDLQFTRLHLVSMFRFFSSEVYRQLRNRPSN